MKIFKALKIFTAVVFFLTLPFLAQASPLDQVSEKDVRALLSKMTLDEKIGQMTQVDHKSLKDINDIEKYHLGSLLSGGDSDPNGGNSLKEWSEMVDRFQRRALKTRLKIPLLYGIDAVHGHNNVMGAVVFPHNIGMGCTRNSQLIKKAAEVTAEEVRATGINWTFAPMVGVPRDKRWGRTYEGFGESPEIARTLGPAAVSGFQGSDLAAKTSVLACAKHFIGDGGTTWGTGKPAIAGNAAGLDQGDVRVTEAALREIQLPGFAAAVEAGVGSIMPSFSSLNGSKCSGDKHLLTDLLKGELGFKGFLISDWAAINDLPGDYKNQIEQAITAGLDMVMVPDKYPAFYTQLKELVEQKRIPLSRINDAVTRILRVKFAMGLMQKNYRPFSDQSLQKRFGSLAHRQVALQAVRESQVLLKNNNKTLPLSKGLKRIVVAGANADNMGNQTGGWTVSWQGKSGDITKGGTTLLNAIKDTVAKTTEVTFSLDGTEAKGADAGIVIVGETPYAEMFGDRDDLHLSEADVKAVQTVKALGIPVVVVIVSGRPMILDQILDKTDAIVAAWLPGTEGQGVADVLFGNFHPTGKLSVSWPRSMKQVSINVGDVAYDPLYAYGFGLTY